jgi:hypothetical protein
LQPGTIAAIWALEKSAIIKIEKCILPQALTSDGIFFRLFLTAWLMIPIPVARVSKIAKEFA